MRVEGDKVVFESTGRIVECPSPFISPFGGSLLVCGYDDSVVLAEPLTDKERREVADWVIAQWNDWAVTGWGRR